MIYAMLIVLGLALGSFINALVWRLHEQDEAKSKKQKAKSELSIVKGRSMCPNCKHMLSALDLIPVVSWLSLKGKCRYCKQPISYQYPLVELLTAATFALSYSWWPTQIIGFQAFSFGCWLALNVVLIALAIYDIKFMLLPNKLVMAAGVIAVLQALAHLVAQPNPASYFLQAILGVAVFGGLFYLLFQISHGRWIGGGDVKLGFVLGLWLAGPAHSLLAIFVASWVGLLIAVLLRLFVKKISMKSQIPFGPMLILATMIVTLFGDRILDIYTAALIYR